jgi:cellulose synthase (UDP-forming)
LAAKVSVINLSLNGQSVATVPVVQASIPESVITTEIPIPADLLTSENTLALALDGRCAPGCNGLTAADLWLEVQPSSLLKLGGSVLALSNDLRLLPEPFFDRLSRGQVSAQIAFDGPPDHKTLEAAGVVASWFGQMADHRALRFSAAIGSVPGGNVIVFAQSRSALVTSLGLNADDGPAVSLRDNPANDFGKILVITGGSSDDLLTAARALATGQYPRGKDSATLGSFRMPPARAAYDAPRWLNTSHSSPLGENQSSEDLSVYGNGTVNLYFQLPPDLYFGTQKYVPLHLIYDLSKWPASAIGELRVRLNGTLVTTRRIVDGAINRHQIQEIGLPVANLTLGNTLAIEFAVGGSRSQSVQAAAEESVSASSAINLSGLDHFVELPRLDLFANAGFPFTKQADLADTAVVLNDEASLQQLGFFLDVLGFLGARTGYPALRVTVVSPTESPRASGKDLLILGSSPQGSESLDRLIQGPAGVAQGEIKLRDASSPLAWLRQLPWASPDAYRAAEEVVGADPGPDGFLSEFASPVSPDHTALAIRATDVTKLEPLEDVFAGEPTIAQVYGSLTLIQGGQFHSFVLDSNRYGQGVLGPVKLLHQWLSENYGILPVFLFIIVMLLSRRLERWLEEHAAFRLHAGSARV